MKDATIRREYAEKPLNPMSGGVMLWIVIVLSAASLFAVIQGAISWEAAAVAGESYALPLTAVIAGTVLMSLIIPLLCAGFKVINPNEALVLLFFGRYYGTIARDGFFWVNPFCIGFNPARLTWTERYAAAVTATKDGRGKDTANNIHGRKISLKAITHNNDKQKINDSDGNPIEIGVVLIWRIVNTAKAVFNVENYSEFVSIQADAATRHVTRQFPYDVANEEEKSLRGSSQQVSTLLKEDLQARVDIAGIEIIEARISHLAYEPEIAAAMLQRQQASAIIAARQKIVDGAVGMVEMALEKLAANKVVTLDEERKAAMVSNLLVVLCGNRDAQPIVNSGTIY